MRHEFSIITDTCVFCGITREGLEVFPEAEDACGGEKVFGEAPKEVPDVKIPDVKIPDDVQ